MAIDKDLQYLKETKDLIKQAIIGKGVDISDTDTFRSYVNKVESITSGGSAIYQEITTENVTVTVSGGTNVTVKGVRVTRGFDPNRKVSFVKMNFSGRGWSTIGLGAAI